MKKKVSSPVSKKTSTQKELDQIDNEERARRIAVAIISVEEGLTMPLLTNEPSQK